jgi:hypothetical protein
MEPATSTSQRWNLRDDDDDIIDIVCIIIVNYCVYGMRTCVKGRAIRHSTYDIRSLSRPFDVRHSTFFFLTHFAILPYRSIAVF